MFEIAVEADPFGIQHGANGAVTGQNFMLQSFKEIHMVLWGLGLDPPRVQYSKQLSA
jgi:hypothetical protein